MADLMDDPELAALRMAALATLKRKKSSEYSTTENHSGSPIPSITTNSTNLHAASEDQDVCAPAFSNNSQQNWRNNSQQTWKRGGPGKIFTKSSSQRSNLIVLTPSGDPPDANEAKDKPLSQPKPPASQLPLPQYKWCPSAAGATEEASSPKNYRSSGPTRFNRYESSDSDSDFDERSKSEVSDSNETILQDEPSTRFFNDASEDKPSSPESDRSKERRLSFHNLDSDLTTEKPDSSNIYNNVKSTYFDEFTHNKNDYTSTQHESSITQHGLNTTQHDAAIVHHGLSRTDHVMPSGEDKYSDKLVSPAKKARVPVTAPTNNDETLSHKRETGNSVSNRSRSSRYLSNDISKKTPVEFKQDDLRFALARRNQNSPNTKALTDRREPLRYRDRMNSDFRDRQRSRSRSGSSSSENRKSRYRRTKKSRSSSYSSPEVKKRPIISSVVTLKSCLKNTTNKVYEVREDKPSETNSVASRDTQNGATDNNKRVPVHMRLGSLNQRKVVPRTKAVEAAFQNSSSEGEQEISITVKSSVSEEKPSQKDERKVSEKSKLPKSREIVWQSDRKRRNRSRH